MSEHLSQYDDLPYANYYVIGRDTFMSGWGPAKNKDNWVLFLCDDEKEAKIVGQSCSDRTDIADYYIVDINNSYDFKFLQQIVSSSENYISLMDREDCERWYTEGAFAHLKD